MLCGYLKQVCKSITVKELIEILQLCKNPDAIVQLSEMTNFFIHFDIDGQFVDFSKSPLANKYGESGKENSCSSCDRYDQKEKACKCTGKGCMNAGLVIDTEKLDEMRISREPVQEETKNEAPREQVSDSKYDLSNYSINGMSIEIVEEPKEEVKHVIPTKDIQESVDKAIINTLSRMINGIKGDK